MRGARCVLIMGLLLGAAGFWPMGSAQSHAVEYVVGFHRLPADRSHYHGDPIVGENEAIRFLVVRTGNPEALERRLSSDSDVAYFERDLELYRILMVPSDTHYAAYQYDMKPATTNMEIAWDRTLGIPAVKVCVVDTGQYRSHQDFRPESWAEWKDFVRGKAAPYDDNGHGTHVTGTIGAVINNARGVSGIAQVSLMGAKVLSRSGSGTVSAVANGITWCADYGAHVINLSLGGGYSSTIENAVNYAHDVKGALVVAAAGNSGPCSNCVSYPAALPNAYAVACTDAKNVQCSFSSEGPEVDIAAPGMSIASTWPPISPCSRQNTDCYVLSSGTSMSAPHVAGLAALVKSTDMTLTHDGLRAKIDGTALDLGPNEKYGAGLIQGLAVY